MTALLQDIEAYLRTVALYGWWKVFTELLLIGIVVYYVMRFVRGTRGARMLQGVAVVLIGVYVIMYLMARNLELDRLIFLYTKFLSFAVFALAVVFQPELRRALMRLSELRLFRGLTSQIAEEIDAIVEAATFLSRRKIGGLMAIERDVGLGGIAESGVKVNADLTPDLLNTIFWPNSPLHDLGVIISGGRVAYASCQFPLAESGELEKELGSRHRAAVGLSQESDAIVVVVSEETGDISVAERGTLIRRLTPDALRGLLGDLLGNPDGGGAAPVASTTAQKPPADPPLAA